MLRARLFLHLMPFVVILVAIGIYAMVLFSRLASALDTSVAENYRSLIAAQEMSLALAGIERDLWASGTQPIVDGNIFAKSKKRFDDNLALQLKNDSLPGEKELNQGLTTSYEAFQKGMDRFISVTNMRSRLRVYEQSIVPGVLKLNSLLKKIRDLNHSAVLATSENIQKVTREVTRLMSIGMAIALVVSGYACYRLSRSILQPIQLLTRATRDLGEGNWDRPVPIISRDELGDLARAFNKMAARLQEYRQSTSENIVQLHRKMETTLASFPDPIFVLNESGNVDLKNPAAVDLQTSLHLDNELPQELRGIAAKMLQTGEDFLPNSFKEVVHYRLNGAGKFFLPRILAMRDVNDALFGVAVVLYDVTRFRLLDAAKSNLVATVSHELKTPLTSIRMTLHLLLEKTLGALTTRQDEMLQAARDDSERLLRILNDLLDLARLDEGDAELHKQSVAPAELLRTVNEEMADSVATRGLKLNWVVARDTPPVSVDRQRIGYVFANLVSNAIKHSPPGGEITLRASVCEGNCVEFSVTDQGPGIPIEFQTRIFDRFFRVPGQNKTGAGLGLSIAREITVAHGGRIGVKSKLGQGSSFFVILYPGPL